MNKTAAYRKFSVVTIIAVYFLIFVGSFVRMTGSGMGCPDWPKCFGQYVPPTDVSELPPDYKEVYKVAGREIADFDPVKTWIEYVNRLVGALIGLFVFITFVLSFSFWKKDKLVTGLSALALFLVGFAGWLGKEVVASDLKPGMITLHMAVALATVAALIYAIGRSRKAEIAQIPLENKGLLTKAVLLCLALTFAQIVLGTQVREMIDHLAKTMGEAARGEWIENSGIKFLIHRSFSLLLLGANLWLITLVRKNAPQGSALQKFAYATGAMMLLEILTGVVMNYMGMPKVMQPAHLVLGSLIFGVQFLMLILVLPRKSNEEQIENSYKQEAVTA